MRGVNSTRVVPVVLLCLVLVSLIYGVSVALSTSLNTHILEKYEHVDAYATYNQVLAYRHYVPTGDPIDNPKPN